MTQPPLTAFDTHIDIPWPERTADGLPAWEGGAREDVWSVETARRFTVPKARQGQVGAVCLAAYIPQATLNTAGIEAAWRRTQAMLDVIHQISSGGQAEDVRLCRTATEIRSAIEGGALAIVPVVENGYGIGDHPERVAYLAQHYGIRYITLTHNGHNQLADAAVARGEDARKYGGLSDCGRAVIVEMNRHGVLVDVSHASKETMMQASELSSTPVFASHSCARALCDHPRNLDDEQLDRLRETGGVIQVTAMAPFLRRGGGGTLEDLVRHITYIAGRIGVEHVGFSSDFDGGGGIEGWQDASQTHHVMRALQEAGFSRNECYALSGGNMLRLLEKSEEVADGIVSRGSNGLFT
ncbi:membrane dipeptidase [Saccharibacter sp. 17.LH.SD]|uniref:dipeptidase n=1 Tax=Saccharibacter sp. 17.LH.SD TaxID=2689393 RepID=UPI00136C77C7|nr:dipeptidase [Saccharibacter sp. 17.LH.SD]MXV44236.1 membrane dipeptidase [Saccharibacter sp. 17.LH.SD]